MMYIPRTSSLKVLILVRGTWCGTYQNCMPGTWYTPVRTRMIHIWYHTARKCKGRFVFLFMYQRIYIPAQFDTIEYCTGMSKKAHVSTFESRTFCFVFFYLVLLPYDVDHTKTKMFKNSRTEHTRIIHMTYSIRAAALLPAVRRWKKTKNDQKPSRGVVHRD